MSQTEGRSSLGPLFVRAARMLAAFPILLIPSVIPAFWQFIAPRIGLIDPSAALTIAYVGFGAGTWRLLGYLLVYVLLLALSQGATVVLVRNVVNKEEMSLAAGFGEAFARFIPLFGVSMAAGLIVSVTSLFYIFPGLVAAFFLWYIVQSVVIDSTSIVGALRGSFRFAATYAGETLVVILATLVVSFVFGLIPFVSWLLMIPTTAFFAALSTLLYMDRET